MAPPGDENLQPRTGDELEITFCILLHVILGGRIKLFKLKLSQQQQQLQQQQNQQQEQIAAQERQIDRLVNIKLNASF